MSATVPVFVAVERIIVEIVELEALTTADAMERARELPGVLNVRCAAYSREELEGPGKDAPESCWKCGRPFILGSEFECYETPCGALVKEEDS